MQVVTMPAGAVGPQQPVASAVPGIPVVSTPGSVGVAAAEPAVITLGAGGGPPPSNTGVLGPPAVAVAGNVAGIVGRKIQVF